MIEILIVLALIALNGLFAMSELSVVSSRRVRLRAFADANVRGAKWALALATEPGRFLSTVQIGITLIGVIAGAFSGATIAKGFTAWLMTWGMGELAAETVGFGLVITAVTFLSIVFGELLPKQLALMHPERIACNTAPLMAFLAQVAWPLVWLLQATSRGAFALFGLSAKSDESVSTEDVKALIAEAERSGSLEASEKQMISGVLRLGARPVTGVMTPRMDVAWIDLSLSEAEIKAALSETAHSRLPVGEGSIDAVMGVVQVRELLADALAGRPFDIRTRVHPATIIPDSADALDVLERLRAAAIPMALVHDEYGAFQGLVTPADLLETIAGSFRGHEDEDEPNAVKRPDGSWLIAGAMPADELDDLLGLKLAPDRSYQTVAGFLLDKFGRIPQVGETLEASGWRFEVLDLDGRRIDKVLASRAPLRRAAG